MSGRRGVEGSREKKVSISSSCSDILLLSQPIPRGYTAVPPRPAAKLCSGLRGSGASEM